jgi:hypothetical protein
MKPHENILRGHQGSPDLRNYPVSSRLNKKENQSNAEMLRVKDGFQTRMALDHLGGLEMPDESEHPALHPHLLDQAAARQVARQASRLAALLPQSQTGLSSAPFSRKRSVRGDKPVPLGAPESTFLQGPTRPPHTRSHPTAISRTIRACSLQHANLLYVSEDLHKNQFSPTGLFRPIPRKCTWLGQRPATLLHERDVPAAVYLLNQTALKNT